MQTMFGLNQQLNVTETIHWLSVFLKIDVPNSNALTSLTVHVSQLENLWVVCFHVRLNPYLSG